MLDRVGPGPDRPTTHRDAEVVEVEMSIWVRNVMTIAKALCEAEACPGTFPDRRTRIVGAGRPVSCWCGGKMRPI